MALKRAAYWLAILATFLAAAEITARVDDRVRLGVPLAAAPSDDDLIVHDEFGAHGRPYARFKKWRLNSFGFRNEEMTALPAADCERVMVLGASESFGLYESDQKEYPAQLSSSLRRAGCYEVVNAAVVGMTVHSISSFWVNWGSRFKPAVVVIYPSPAFYLGERSPWEAKSAMSSPRPDPVQRRWWQTPRLLDRARDVIVTPRFIQTRRITQWLADGRAGKPASWLFETVPEERLQQFLDDVDALAQEIAARGAQPIIVTHATAFHLPPLTDELDALKAWNAFAPRASMSVLLEFEQAAARGMIDLAARRRMTVIDAASYMNGHRRWFAGDFIHFSDEGAGVMAKLINDRLTADRGQAARVAETLATTERPHALQ